MSQWQLRSNTHIEGFPDTIHTKKKLKRQLIDSPEAANIEMNDFKSLTSDQKMDKLFEVMLDTRQSQVETEKTVANISRDLFQLQTVHNALSSQVTDITKDIENIKIKTINQDILNSNIIQQQMENDFCIYGIPCTNKNELKPIMATLFLFWKHLE